jgi:hypothetical protein
MLQIYSTLRTINRFFSLQSVKLILFLSSQLVCVALAIASLHYLQIREQAIADTYVHRITILLKDKAQRLFDTVDKYTDELIHASHDGVIFGKTLPEDGVKNLLSFKSKLPVGVSSTTVYNADLKNTKTASTTDSLVDAFLYPYLKNLDKSAAYREFVVMPPSANTPVSVYLLHKLHASNQAFKGIVAINIDLKPLFNQCSPTIPSTLYEVFVVDKRTKTIVMRCTDLTNTNDALVHLNEYSSIFSKEGTPLTSGRFEDNKHLAYVEDISTSTGLQIITIVNKDVIYGSLNGLIWQNYLLFMVGLLSQILCYMMFTSALKQSGRRKSSRY